MLQLWSITYARHSFVGSSVVDLESNHPDVVEEMLASSVKLFPVGVDGVCRSRRSGNVHWAPRVSAAQLIEGFGYFGYGYGSAAAASIALADTMLTLGEPELPTVRADGAPARDPAGGGDPAAARSHNWCAGLLLRLPTAALSLTMVAVQTTSKPHWHAEWPPLTWLKEKYPARGSVESADAHAQQWLGCMRASEVLLAAWDEGVFVDMVPGRPLPLSGMIACIE
eukprot:SAG31_NODE_6613_length_1950_cov_5.966541_1_plen_225_part_00